MTLTSKQINQLNKASELFLKDGKIIGYKLLLTEYSFKFYFQAHISSDLKNVTPVYFSILRKGFSIFKEYGLDDIEIYLYE